MKLCLALGAFAAVSSASFNVDGPGDTTFWTVIRSSSSTNTTLVEPVTTMTLTINSTMSGTLTVYNNGFPSSTTTVVNMVEPTSSIKASSTVLVLVPPHVRSTTTVRSTVSTHRLLVSPTVSRTRHSTSTVHSTRRSSSTASSIRRTSSTASSTRSTSVRPPVTTTTVTTKRCKKPTSTSWSTSFRTVRSSKPTTSMTWSTSFRTVHPSEVTKVVTKTNKRCKDTSTSHSRSKTTITTSQGE